MLQKLINKDWANGWKYFEITKVKRDHINKLHVAPGRWDNFTRHSRNVLAAILKMVRKRSSSTQSDGNDSINVKESER